MQSITWTDLENTNDLQELESMYHQLCYVDALRSLIDLNLIEVVMKINQFFVFRIYFREEEKWNFYGYGKLTKEGQMLALGTDLESLESGAASQTVFIFRRGLSMEAQITPHYESRNHLVVLIGDQKYLLYSKHAEVVHATLRQFY